MAGPLAQVKRDRQSAPTRLLAMVALAAAAGCSRQGALSGTVAVPGADVSAIAVRIVPEKDVAAWLAARRPQAQARLEELQAAYQEASRTEDQAVRTYQDEFGRGQSAAVTRDGVTITADADSAQSGEHLYHYDPQQHSSSEARGLAAGAVDEARQKYEEGRARFEGDKASLDQGLGAARGGKQAMAERVLAWETESLADLPSGGVTAYTDAQGRFKAELPGRGRFALVADGTFKLNGTTQHRGWGLWIDLKGAPTASVTLDPNNLLLETPRDSLLR